MTPKTIEEINREIQELEMLKECNTSEICTGCGVCIRIVALEIERSNIELVENMAMPKLDYSIGYHQIMEAQI